MNKTTILAAMSAALMLPAIGQAQEQKTKQLSNDITEVRLENYASLRVMQGESDRFVYNGQFNEKSTKTSKGTRLVIDKPISDVTLYLRPGRSMVFNTQDFSLLTLEGDFAPSDSLVLHAEDYSRIEYKGDMKDTLRARHLRMYGEDYSHISSSNPVQYGVGRHTAVDYSRIDLTAADLCSRLAPEGVAEDLFSNSDFGRINSGRYTKDGELQHERMEDVGDEALQVMDKVSSTIGDLARKSAKKQNPHPWNTDLDLAFGWHNWGSELGSGFSGVEGPAAVSTNFHNIQLAINIPVINVRGFAFKAGLGFNWDRYNFIDPAVVFDATATPMSFDDMANGVSTVWTRLKTRSVVVPLKLEFGNPKKWHFSLTALPGLNWSGNNTGLRRKVEVMGGTSKVKDYSVNRYFNPYSLDLRAAVQYKSIGLYVQTAMVPLLKDGCQDLFPVKFGIIL